MPVPGGPKKQTLLCSVIQASCARCRISGRSAPGWAVKSKSSRVLCAGNAAWRMRWRAPEASRAKTSASSSDLEELLVGPALLARPRGGLLEALQHAWCLELGEQVGQPLADRRRSRCRSCAELGVVARARAGRSRGPAIGISGASAGGSGRSRGAGCQVPRSIAALVVGDALAAMLDPDPVAVPAQLDALMNQRLRGAVEAAGVLEIAVQRDPRRARARPRRKRPAATPAAARVRARATRRRHAGRSRAGAATRRGRASRRRARRARPASRTAAPARTRSCGSGPRPRPSPSRAASRACRRARETRSGRAAARTARSR